MITFTKHGVTFLYIDILQLYLIGFKLSGILTLGWFYVLLPCIVMSIWMLVLGFIGAVATIRKENE